MVKKKRKYKYRGVISDRPWTAKRKAAFDSGYNQAVYPYRHKAIRFKEYLKYRYKRRRRRRFTL